MNKIKLTASERRRRYHRTLRGMVSNSLGHQRSSSKKRGHVPPNYDLNTLYDWAIAQERFIPLYEAWVASDYLTALKPSFDRLDDSLPYTFDNLQVLTWKENHAKGAYDTRFTRLNPKNTSGTRGVRLRTDGAWQARIEQKGKTTAKTFETKERAIEQRLLWESQLLANLPLTILS